jgi:HlyD family secretion protein
MEKPTLDLNKLAIDRTAAKPTTAWPDRRWLVRYMVPASLLLGFAALVMTAAGTQFLPTQPVTVIPVVVQRGEAARSGEPLFQTPGWIEPRPTAISVTAMTPGVIEELMVVAGQRLEKNDPVARLIAIDAELALEQARNGLAISEGELSRANAEWSAARARLEQPVHLQAILADSRSALAKVETELAKLPYLIKAAESDLAYAKSSLENKRSARQAISENVIALAEKDHAIAEANLAELRQRLPNVEREILALREKAAATAKQAVLLIDENQQVQEAEAKCQSARAVRDGAAVRVRQAELALERTVVRSPIDGQVLRVVAAPGTRVMGLEGTAGQNASTVIEMFEPSRLQVRADVRLEDVPLVFPGQLVEVETASSKEAIAGRVLQITSQANIQKNTLEVKVELIEPPATVRPEMLVTANFLSADRVPSDVRAGERERIYVPEKLIQTTEGSAGVWVVDSASTAHLRSVQVGANAEGGLVEIRTGLQITDKLIVTGAEGLTNGSRVRIASEDSDLGVN